mmetsp:Transcript_1037/g.1940  ORF Transcript_1037/g.1940 Transcript_1037/m.1940 type:complete len:131 (-) Transcript_1037:152-544(-)
MSKLFGKSGGKATQDAVNHLYARVEVTKGHPARTFTSECVVKQLITRKLGHKGCPAHTLQNPSFAGWVVEIDFLTQVSMAWESKGNEIEVADQARCMSISKCGGVCVSFAIAEAFHGSSAGHGMAVLPVL